MKTKFEKMSHSDKKFLLSIAIAVPVTVFISILIGLTKSITNIDIIVLAIGVISSQIYRRVARGFVMRIAIASVLTALLGLIIVECVSNFGFEGVFVFRNYQTLLNFVVQEDVFKVSWSVYRLITLLIAYSYARVV